MVGRPTVKIVAGVAARVDVDVGHLIAAAGRTHRGQLSSLVEVAVVLPWPDQQAQPFRVGYGGFPVTSAPTSSSP
jgi:hypothetical protein